MVDLLDIGPGRGQRSTEASLELLPKARHPPGLDQEGHPGPATRLAQALVPKQERDRQTQLGCLLERHEDVQRASRPESAGALLAADSHVEAGHALAVQSLHRWP